MPTAKEKDSSIAADSRTTQASQDQALPGLVLVESGAIFQGNEEFVVTRSAINLEKPGYLTKEKITAVEKLLRPSYLTGRSALFIGSKPGFFAFSALQNDAESVKVLDPDRQYLKVIEKAASHIGFNNFHVVNQTQNASGETEHADVIVALNAEQWCTNTDPVALDKKIEALSKACGYLLLIESPSEVDLQPALLKHFKIVTAVDAVDGKSLFAAFKKSHELDLSCPMPKFQEGGEVISCRLLTEFAGLQYWSRVYSGDGAIYKQATRDLVQREQLMLSKLVSAYFPRVTDVRECGDSSVLVLEKIDGVSLDESVDEVTSSVSRFTAFVVDCLHILAELQSKKIEHRDIQAGNLLIREGKPVLIDFGWAVSPEMPMFVPAGLLSVGPDGQVCDAYSFGRIFQNLSADRFPEFDALFNLMLEPDPSARVTCASDLIDLIKMIHPGDDSANLQQNWSAGLVAKMVNGLKLSQARLTAEAEKLAQLEAKVKAEKDHRLAVLEMEFEKVVNDNTKVISELKRVITEKDELLVLLDERQKLIEGITQSQAWQLANRLQKSKQSINRVFKKSP